MEDQPPARELEELERLFRGVRSPFDMVAMLAVLFAAIVLDLVATLLMVTGIVAVIVHARADRPHLREDPRARMRSRVALRVALLIMWVLDHGPFGDTRRRSRTARSDRPRI